MLGNLKSFAPATHDLENSMSVSRTLRSRVSVRAYTSEALSIETVNEILDAAALVAIGRQYAAVEGDRGDEVCELAHRALAPNPAGEEGDYPVQPDECIRVSVSGASLWCSKLCRDGNRAG